MALVRYVEYAEASPEVKAVYDDIMRTRGVDLAVVGLANETNRLANGLRLDVDPQFK
jgi:hypothetical protein